MKNFILVEAPAARRERHLLLHLRPDVEDKDREVSSFSHFSRWLTRKGYADNTIIKYSENVAYFLDYLFEASQSQALIDHHLDLEDVIYSYEAFMLFGQESANPLSKELAKKLGKQNKTSPISLGQNIQASIQWFIDVSLLGLAENGNFDPFFGLFFKNKSRLRSTAEKAKIREKSWLAGTIRHSLRHLSTVKGRESLFPGVKRSLKESQSNTFKVNPFPIEHSVTLVRSIKPSRSRSFHRDMALYSLLASSGMRIHEALQLRFIDIITDKTGSIRIELYSPYSRLNPGLTESETKKLAWKGRETARTFMIEPFASIFWEHFNNYLNLEYKNNVNHDFVFQNQYGRPLFTSDRKGRNQTFKNYTEKARIPNAKNYSIHSLRHMYGTYILNYMPVPGNRIPGLPLVYVQRLMGHASSSSTRRYARHDEDVLDAYIEHANRYLMGQGENALAETRISFHSRQIQMLEKEFEAINTEAK